MAAGIAFACFASISYWKFAKPLHEIAGCKQISPSAGNRIFLRFPFKNIEKISNQ
jgi:hypothetical protein